MTGLEALLGQLRFCTIYPYLLYFTILHYSHPMHPEVVTKADTKPLESPPSQAFKCRAEVAPSQPYPLTMLVMTTAATTSSLIS